MLSHSIATRNRERREGNGASADARMEELRFLLRLMPGADRAFRGLGGGPAPVAGGAAGGGIMYNILGCGVEVLQSCQTYQVLKLIITSTFLPTK